jgi:hypothetical protein
LLAESKALKDAFRGSPFGFQVELPSRFRTFFWRLAIGDARITSLASTPSAVAGAPEAHQVRTHPPPDPLRHRQRTGGPRSGFSRMGEHRPNRGAQPGARGSGPGAIPNTSEPLGALPCWQAILQPLSHQCVRTGSSERRFRCTSGRFAPEQFHWRMQGRLPGLIAPPSQSRNCGPSTSGLRDSGAIGRSTSTIWRRYV